MESFVHSCIPIYRMLGVYAVCDADLTGGADYLSPFFPFPPHEQPPALISLETQSKY